MKSIKTIISIVFVVGTIALIIYDSQTRESVVSVKSNLPADSANRHLNK